MRIGCICRREISVFYCRSWNDLKQASETKRAIVKYANPLDPYCSTIDEVMLIAIPDDKYYTARDAGEMHPSDEAKIKHK